jgi:hypothetical protein
MIKKANGSYEVREPAASYAAVFDAKNGDSMQKNTSLGDILIEIQ